MQGKRLQAKRGIFHLTTSSHQGAILIEEILQMLGRVEQYSITQPSSIKALYRLEKSKKKNVQKGE